MKRFALGCLLLLLPGLLAAQEIKKRVVEEIVARVNNEIITLSDYQEAMVSTRRDVEEECRGCTRDKIESLTAERQKNLLRDLIDNLLLAQRAKDLGFNVETDLIKYMDRLRQDNKLPDLDALCQAIEGTGISCEDWKSKIRNQMLSQEVIRKEVGRSIQFSKDEVQKYYDEHKSEFVRPEQVYLLEIFVSTEGKPEAEIPNLQKKAENLLDRVRNKGEDFEELAKRYSDGSTAQQGGVLGTFERGQLSPELEAVAFKMDRGQVSDIIRTKSGFLILKVEMRYDAGQQPVDKVEGEIMNRLYMTKIQPALRDYLQKLREESYVMVKPGYVDTAAVAALPIEEVQPVPQGQQDKKKKSKGKEKSTQQKSGSN